MANYQSVATMCEVTYDSDWYEDDRFITPYRYSLMRNDTESNSDTVSLTLPSYTYYEYLRSLYDCRSTALHRNPPVSMNFGQNSAAELSLPDLQPCSLNLRICQSCASKYFSQSNMDPLVRGFS